MFRRQCILRRNKHCRDMPRQTGHPRGAAVVFHPSRSILNSWSKKMTNDVAGSLFWDYKDLIFSPEVFQKCSNSSGCWRNCFFLARRIIIFAYCSWIFFFPAHLGEKDMDGSHHPRGCLSISYPSEATKRFRVQQGRVEKGSKKTEAETNSKRQNEMRTQRLP